MVSVPAPRLFQYMARSHHDLVAEVVTVTMMEARPLMPGVLGHVEGLPGVGRDGLGLGHVARAGRGHVGDGDLTRLCRWGSAPGSRSPCPLRSARRAGRRSWRGRSSRSSRGRPLLRRSSSTWPARRLWACEPCTEVETSVLGGSCVVDLYGLARVGRHGEGGARDRSRRLSGR